MGTMISLGVGKLEIDWGKNSIFENFCDLFQPEDWKDIKYYYADNEFEIKKGYSRKLSLVKPRLNLLGYTLPNIKTMYEDNYKDYVDNMGEYAQPILTFDEYFDVFSKIDLSKVNTLTEYDDWDFGEYASKCVFEDEEIQRLLTRYIDRRSGTFYENLPPRLLVRVLCENPTAQNIPLQWYMLDHVESGWSKEDELAPKLEDKDKILIVTEGKSDTFILKTVINGFFSEVSDFFYFIDMQENYPFTGTGNLYNFASGLIKIKLQNKTIIIFDNDEAGIFSYNKCMKNLDSIPNLKFYHLPNIPEFERFLTIGPTGKSYQDINGKAVSIECFLDLAFGVDNPPEIRWTIYNEKSQKYQGALIAKDNYTRIFKASLFDDKYNKEKLIFLIEDIIDFWCDNYCER
ncbi:MAG: hypothetical protein E7544_01335 [Ruminococcaceae bacterium]|nr:hypothetical protein [Oscillospiraceae bacterium]